MKIEVKTNETVNNEQKAQTFKTLRYGPLEYSENIILGSSRGLDLQIFNTNIQNLNAPHILPELIRIFYAMIKMKISPFCTFIQEALIKILKISKCFYQIETLVLA